MTPTDGWDDGGWPPAPQPRRRGAGPARPAGRKAFGATWWGAAWVDALQRRASLDPNRLPRGRSYARSGQVARVEVHPGEIRCEVQGSRAKPYAVRVRVRTFTGPEWEHVLDVLAAQAGHTAALLDGELLPDVADDVRRAGLDLLPGAGELQPRCSCPDWADPCKHSAAVCYLMADELDRDPFVLLLLRGRGRDEVMAGLRSRRRGTVTSAADRAAPDERDHDPGVAARDAWGRPP
ncbi:MAG: SWIM zinc finger family protein, partial [Acidimicrobiales bacterium]